MKGKLILEDGSVFYGNLLDSDGAMGEVVFHTGMSGYQEVLTDPSYCGQIVTLTYPLVGNYGVAEVFNQSAKPFVHGFIIGELCEEPSNCQAEGKLSAFLSQHKIPCLYGVDTRAVTRKIRSAGTMKGVIVKEDASKEDIEALFSVPIKKDVVKEVSTDKIYQMTNAGGPSVVVMDFGIKRSILRSLHGIGCDLTVVPADTKAKDVLAMNPDGILLSNGPGNPKDVPEAVATVKELLNKKPIFGICLGHQVLALALGADTYKLKFGHRGVNQPVKSLLDGRVYISSQSHGYAVDEKSLENLPVKVTHRAVNDGSVEGLRHNALPVFSVQYHPEVSPGSADHTCLLDEFLSVLKKGE